MEWLHSINSEGEIIMTVKELIEKLEIADPDLEVIVIAPDSGYWTDEYIEYGIDEKDIGVSFGRFSIGVG